MKETTIGTWNVRSLHACGKAQDLTHDLKRYRWGILGLILKALRFHIRANSLRLRNSQSVQSDGQGLGKLPRMKYTRSGQTTTNEGDKIWYCGEDSKHQYGVAFIAGKRL